MKTTKCYVKVEGVGNTPHGERLQVSITKELVRELDDTNIATAINLEIIEIVKELKCHIDLDYDETKASATYPHPDGTEFKNHRFDDRQETSKKPVSSEVTKKSPFLDMLEGL